MATKAAGLSTSNPRAADARNITHLGTLIERCDDIVSLIARNRAARAGLGKTGRAVLRDHERQLEAELAGIRELASHIVAETPAEAQFLLILAVADLVGLRAQGPEPGRAAVLDRIERLLHGVRWGLDQSGDGENEGTPLYRIAEHVAPFVEGPHSRAAMARQHIEQAEAANG